MGWWIALLLLIGLIALGLYAGMMLITCIFVAIRESLFRRKP